MRCRSNRNKQLCAALLVASLGSCTALAAEATRGTEATGGEPPPLEHMMNQFLSTSEEIADQPEGREPVDFLGPPDKPNWFQVLMVTHDSNPLLEEKCKQNALEFSVETLRLERGMETDTESLRAAYAHMKEHQDFIRDNRVSYADYLRNIAECEEFCGPLVAQLVQCHVVSVARHIHGIVLFELASDRVAEDFDRGVLASVAAHLVEEPKRKVLLIGRASAIGPLHYNRRLAARRTLAVRDRLLDRGLEPERIEVMWFGWEPPQIDALIAEEYGFGELFRRQGEAQMNQSVMLVLY